MPAGIVHAQQAVAGDFHVEERAGNDEAGDVALLVLLADAAEQLAGLVVTQHDAIAGVGDEHIVFASRRCR